MREEAAPGGPDENPIRPVCAACGARLDAAPPPGGADADPLHLDFEAAAPPPHEPPPPGAPPPHEPPPPGAPPPPGPRGPGFQVRAGEELVAWLKTFASAAVYATLIVTFGFQVARVEGKSMEPTLQDQDRLIVNKAVYKFFEDPRPGDIVMHYYPADPDKSFVKRIIAQPGDTVRIEDGTVYVNEAPFPDAVPPEFRSREDYGPEIIQDAFYFVMGDHRSNSSDSRTWGQVPKEYIVGKVQLRWWPLTEATVF